MVAGARLGVRGEASRCRLLLPHQALAAQALRRGRAAAARAELKRWPPPLRAQPAAMRGERGRRGTGAHPSLSPPLISSDAPRGLRCGPARKGQAAERQREDSKSNCGYLSSPPRSHLQSRSLDSLSFYGGRSGCLLDARRLRHCCRSGCLLDARRLRHCCRRGGFLDARRLRHCCSSGCLLDARRLRHCCRRLLRSGRDERLERVPERSCLGELAAPRSKQGFDGLEARRLVLHGRDCSGQAMDSGEGEGSEEGSCCTTATAHAAGSRHERVSADSPARCTASLILRKFARNGANILAFWGLCEGGQWGGRQYG